MSFVWFAEGFASARAHAHHCCSAARTQNIRAHTTLGNYIFYFFIFCFFFLPCAVHVGSYNRYARLCIIVIIIIPSFNWHSCRTTLFRKVQHTETTVKVEPRIDEWRTKNINCVLCSSTLNTLHRNHLHKNVFISFMCTTVASRAILFLRWVEHYIYDYYLFEQKRRRSSSGRICRYMPNAG